jgi:hypothetical protein
MRKPLAALTCVLALGILGLTTPASAEQKTVRACQEEWRVDKAANQAKRITEKAYIADCRAKSTTAEQAAPSAKTAASPRAVAGQKTVKACQEEWRANKPNNQANGITEKAFVVQCRAGGTIAQTPPPTPPAQTPSATPPSSATPGAPPIKPAPAPTASTAPAGPNQFATESAARGRCPPDTVVWVNLDSKIYHYAGHRSYGRTKTGAYMCEQDTTAQGMRASKNEKRPG